jgi:hypothetical protein
LFTVEPCLNAGKAEAGRALGGANESKVQRILQPAHRQTTKEHYIKPFDLPADGAMERLQAAVQLVE